MAAAPPPHSHRLTPLAERIESQSGMHLTTGKRWLLAARVQERMSRLQELNLDSYLARLLEDNDAAELECLIELLRVGETRFFRNEAQLRAIRRVVLPELAMRRSGSQPKRIRVWSAGCASGEEAYTVAMILEAELPSREGWDHRILATDLSPAALEHARAGRYSAQAVERIPNEHRRLGPGTPGRNRQHPRRSAWHDSL